MNVALKPGWLARDVRSASIAVAKDELTKAERRVRNANDDLAEANTALKVARNKLRRLEQETRK